MGKTVIKKEQIVPVFESKFVSLYDIQYKEGKHYYDATRRTIDNLTATKSDKEFQNMQADAVSCVVVIKLPDKEPQLLLSYEYRYPTGQYLLSVPAGLIDEEDKDKEDAPVITTIREIKEETGIDVKASDTVKVINPLVFSTPGLTDESNALVYTYIELDDLSSLNQEGCVGSELFDGFELYTKEDAKKALLTGRDKKGNFYPVYTWVALSYFVNNTDY